jgi:hypothetical protein
VHQGGYTWHSPGGDYAQGPPEHIAQLQTVMDALLRDAARYEGISLPDQASRARTGARSDPTRP